MEKSAIRRGAATSVLFPTCLAAVVFGGVENVLKRQEAAVRNEIVDGQEYRGEVRPLADIVSLTRALNLVTVEVKSSVRVEQSDSNWRGTAKATLETPVRYLYGVDLAKLESSAFKFSPLSECYQIRIPLPRRLAVEVITSNPSTEEVKTTGFRPRAGIWQLSQARRSVYDEACRQVLPPELAKQVCEQSKEQIAAVVRQFVGGSCRVEISFARNDGTEGDR